MTGFNDSVCKLQIKIARASVITNQPTYSDHQYINIDIRADFPGRREERKLLRQTLHQKIQDLHLQPPKDLQTDEDINQYVKYLMGKMQRAIEGSTVPVCQNRQPVQWWNEELEPLKKLGLRTHQLALQSQNPL